MEYYFSEKGAAAYKAIDKEYPKHSFDFAYDRFKRQTRNSTENEFFIGKMVRLQIPSEDDETQEFILYDLKEIRKNGLGNKQSYVRCNLGKYPIPEKITKIEYDEDHQPVQKVAGIGEINIGYEFPFTKEKAEELHKLGCNDKFTIKRKNKTQYICQKLNEVKISVSSYKDWLEGDFETLYQYGNMEGEEKTVVRPKIKKSKAQEQSDIQKEILRKNYTVNKPKEEKDIKYDEPIKQETVTAGPSSYGVSGSSPSGSDVSGLRV